MICDTSKLKVNLSEHRTAIVDKFLSKLRASVLSDAQLIAAVDTDCPVSIHRTEI
nr:hypothetical protein [uncultured Undibacterium sp.]